MPTPPMPPRDLPQGAPRTDASGQILTQPLIEVPAWEVQELTFRSSHDYDNPYADVAVWVDLEGPGFRKRVYGFWDGGRTFKVRLVGTAPGEWRWRSGCDRPDNTSLNGNSGGFLAVDASDAEKAAHPNRRGFIRPTPDGHALQYADGTSFFLIGDTWLAASTWRLPMRGHPPAGGYVPGPGISFEGAVAWRKRQGFNSVSFIAAFPNWSADHRSYTYAGADGVFVRNAWEKFGHWAADGTPTAKDMHDEQGHRPFEVPDDRDGVADFDRIDPAYFRSLDRKMRHLSDEGFVPMIETVRRDSCPTWRASSHDFNSSYARYVNYLVARYGAYNIIFSGIHLDWIPPQYSLTADEFNAALGHHHSTYGPLPFGQPCTALIDSSTSKRFGHGGQCPWLTMHSVGNNPRSHAIYASLEELFRLDPPYPAVNLEPYFTGWNHNLNKPGGERPPVNSERDNYFARAQMYGSVLSGALAGHVHGTAAYDMTTTGEPPGWRPYIWEALQYTSGDQMRHLATFILSEGPRYRELQLASDDIHPRQAPDTLADGLDGWSFMMRTPGRDLAMLYFEAGCVRPRITGMAPGSTYQWTWYNPRHGHWLPPVTLAAVADGTLETPPFPDGTHPSTTDWAAKTMAQPSGHRTVR